ncbi:MAG: DMT family transporter [Tenericutes bacterium]|jgi:drug/metabolite transporter (DMT)-like permease|nr:DMT family transporter [Mycoplasmatota bacterium]
MFKGKSVIYIAVVYALLAAFFYGFSAPFSKLLLDHISPYLMSSLLYFGAGIGMLLVVLLSKQQRKNHILKGFKKPDIKYIVLMVLLDIVAPILLMIGLTKTTASTASLLNNFEIVFTAIIAMFFFKEVIGKKMWISIVLILMAGVLLSFEDYTGFHISMGALFVMAASLSWGLENNCTRMLSKGNPLHVVVIKGFGSGLGSLIIALSVNQYNAIWYYILLALILGFFSYGLSLYFYISAQRHLGAARTSAYYAVAPFAGALFSFLILKESPTLVFFIAFVVMGIGTYLSIRENNEHAETFQQF